MNIERERKGKIKMAKSRMALRAKKREEYLEKIINFFKESEDVLRTNSNEISFPIIDEEGNEDFIQIVVKIPTGSRDGEPYDGYAKAEEYALKIKLKEEKAKEAKIAKEKKIARDKQMREEKKRIKEKERAKAKA